MDIKQGHYTTINSYENLKTLYGIIMELTHLYNEASVDDREKIILELYDFQSKLKGKICTQEL